MRRVSVTELEVWQQCRLKWEYKYRRKLRPRPSATPSPLISGSAVHFGVEAGLAGQDAAASALVALRRYGEETAAKYERGVLTALGGVPEWVWGVKLPQTEMKLEVVYGEEVTVVGKPDLWYLDDEGIHVVEFKTSGTDERARLERYETWNPQPLRYLALLSRVLPLSYPTYSRHILLSTRGRHAVGEEELVSKERLVEVEREMVEIACEVGMLPLSPHWLGGGCDWCEFRSVDEVRFKGKGAAAAIEQELEKEERM